MDDTHKAELLRAAVEASNRAAELRAQADDASAARRLAVRACMDAGIPRAEIMAALGITRATLYQVAGKPDQQ